MAKSNNSYRGLDVFIKDIRACGADKGKEEVRVAEELANIRGKYLTGKMSAYDRKKYTAKLMYVYMLGYDVDFGHMEAVALLNSSSYTDKNMGYLFVSLLLNENHELVPLIIQSILNDLTGHHEQTICAALTCISNIGGREMAEALISDVVVLLTNASASAFVRKKAALCLLRLYRKFPDALPADEWIPRVRALITERQWGVLSCVTSLVTGMVAADPAPFYDAVVRPVVNHLTEMKTAKKQYNNVTLPWLYVKFLRLLQYFDVELWSAGALKDIARVLERLLARWEAKPPPREMVNQVNAQNMIHFEAIRLAVVLGDEALIAKAGKYIGKGLRSRETNTRYLSLDAMSQLARASAEARDSLVQHQSRVLASLKDNDISIRRRALEVLYAICCTSNSREIVGSLLHYLSTADEDIREELVLRIAVLAEKFATDFSWYIDAVLQLITLAGDHVTDAVWHRVVHIVSRNPTLQPYAAQSLYGALRRPRVHPTTVKAGAYVLGEFGCSLVDAGRLQVEDVVSILEKYSTSRASGVRGHVLHALAKVSSLYPETATRADAVFNRFHTSVDEELRQRSVEYAVLNREEHADSNAAAWDEMPPFESRGSSLEQQIRASQKNTDISAWARFEDAPTNTAEAGTGAAALTATAIEDLAERQAKQVVDDAEEAAVEAAEQKEAERVLERERAHTVEAPTSTASFASVAPKAVPAPIQVDSLKSHTQLLDLSTPTAAGPSSSSTTNLVDLLGAPVAPVTVAPSAVTAAPQAVISPAASLDLLGAAIATPVAVATPVAPVAAVPASAPVVPVTSSPVSPSSDGREEWRKTLIHGASGVLFEDHHIQIGWRSEYHGPLGRIGVYFGNKTGGQLSGFKAAITALEAGGVVQNVEQPPPAVVPPGTQATLILSLQCRSSAIGSPVLAVTWDGCPAGILRVGLPVTHNKFLEPMGGAMDGNRFFGAWRAVPQAGERQTIFDAPPALMTPAHPAVAAILAGIGLTSHPGIDGNPANYVLSAHFHTAASAPGAPAPMPLVVVARLEPNQRAGKFRVTVRTSDPLVAESIAAVVVELISTISL